MALFLLCFPLRKGRLADASTPRAASRPAPAALLLHPPAPAALHHIGFETAFAVRAASPAAPARNRAATVFHSYFRGAGAFVAFSGAFALIYLLAMFKTIRSLPAAAAADAARTDMTDHAASGPPTKETAFPWFN